MAWTAPRTWATGELVTAAMLNAQIRDNLLFAGTTHVAKVYKSGNQNVNTNAGDGFTALSFDTEDTDTDAFHDAVTNNSRLTCPAGFDGWYIASGLVVYTAAAGGGRRDCAIRKNGATVFTRSRIPPGSAAADKVAVSDLIYLAATDYVELGANQDSGAAVAVVGVGLEQTHFSLARIAL